MFRLTKADIFKCQGFFYFLYVLLCDIKITHESITPCVGKKLFDNQTKPQQDGLMRFLLPMESDE